MSLATLFTILNLNKVDGSNFVDWKHSLDNVLNAKESLFVFEKECLLAPTSNSSEDERVDHNKWNVTDKTVKCYILTCMPSVL